MAVNLDEGASEKSDNLAMKMEEMRAVKVVGKGAVGTVFLVEKEGCDKLLALKAMSKADIEKHNNGLARLRMEREILRKLRHPFLPALIGHVETEKIVGWVVDYCAGGDLNALRRRQSEKMFSESIIRFYAAEIVLALEHLHSEGVIYRDLKPENVLVQSNGHIMLTDFDLSTSTSTQHQRQEEEEAASSHITRRRGLFALMTWCMRPSRAQVKRSNAARVSPVSKKPGGADVAPPKTRTQSFVGTTEYVSPEMLSGEGYGFAVDWWALGVLLYEMLYGRTPFKGSTRKDTFYHILVREPQFTAPSTPLHDLIVKLLSKEPQKRLGSRKGSEEIKRHPFFRGLDWEAVENVSRAPFVPPPLSLEDVTRMEALDVEECLEKQVESEDKTRSPEREETDGFRMF